jgi:uncharacterized delta-60 repeat protein
MSTPASFLPRLFALSALAAFLLAVGDAASAPADAFPRFGNDNRVLTAFPGEAEAAGIARDNTGAMVVAGTVTGPGGSDIAVARYLLSGRLDPSFGDDGTVVYDFGGDENAGDVVIGSGERIFGGRIVVGGWSGSASAPAAGEALVFRLLPDGGLDPSFGDGGVARPGPGGVQAVESDSRERVIAAGSREVGPLDTPWQVWRLTAEGQPDSSFGGGDGVASGSVGGDANSAEDLVLNVRGRVTIAVCAQTAEASNSFAVVRLRSDGSLDPTFGGGSGTVSVDFGAAACPRSLAIDRRSWIVAAGTGRRDMLVTRLRWDGSFDPNFSGDGRARVRFPGFDARLGRIAVDGNRRIYLAGQVTPTSGSKYPSRFALARLDRDARLDPNFGRGGRVAISFGAGKASEAGASSLTVRGGVAYAAGFAVVSRSASPPARFALVRYIRPGERLAQPPTLAASGRGR